VWKQSLLFYLVPSGSLLPRPRPPPHRHARGGKEHPKYLRRDWKKRARASTDIDFLLAEQQRVEGCHCSSLDAIGGTERISLILFGDDQPG